MKNNKYIVISGVSTGIGYGAVRAFIDNGYFVFGSVRKQEDADRLKKEFGNNFEALIFDVTNENEIYKAVEIVEKKLGNNTLNGLINNAGTVDGAPLMHVTLDNLRNHFDVLVVGQLAVTQAFLPLLGAKLNNTSLAGKIIFISSTSGKRAYPFMGAYVSAKHALEGMSDCLRMEMQIYGIDVVIVEPGMIKTRIWEKQDDKAIEKFVDTDYYIPGKKLNQFYQNALRKNAIDLDKFSLKLLKIFEKRNPRIRYVVVKNKLKNWTLPRLLPERIMDRFFIKVSGLQKLN